MSVSTAAMQTIAGRRRFVVLWILCICFASTACRTIDIHETWREQNWSFSRRVANIAILNPTVSDSAHESPLLYAARPFIWISELISFRLPGLTPTAETCVAPLRSALSSYFETAGLHAIDTTDVDGARETDRDLREVGADYALHTTIAKWSRGYFIIQSWVRIQLECQLVRLADGVVVWDGVIETTRAKGLLQLASPGLKFVVPIPPTAGPYLSLSALTGPLAMIRGSVYYELLRDAARNLTRHICPGVIERCTCNLCHGTEGQDIVSVLLDTLAAGKPDPGLRQNYIIQAIVAGSKDDKNERVVYRAGDRVDVLAIAPMRAMVSFDFGSYHRGIPMICRGEIDREGYKNYGLFQGLHIIDPTDIRELPDGTNEIALRIDAVIANSPAEISTFSLDPIAIVRDGDETQR
ncbi:MAG: hypothetical protein HY286_17430 [Planctomycetes bacterium]|nr:hypothetical protein [Planctomycetota bacterium]